MNEITKTIHRIQERQNTMTSGTEFTTIQRNLFSRAYRVLADIYEYELKYYDAIKALQNMIQYNPMTRTKVLKEIERLQQQCS